VTDEDGSVSDGLRLFCQNPSNEENPILWRSANVLTQKLIYPAFEAETVMDASGLKVGDKAGVCMTGGQYVAAFIERDESGEYLVKTIHSEGDDNSKTEVVDLSLSFKKTAQEKNESFDYALKNIKWVMTFTGGETYFQDVKKDPDREQMKLKVYLSFDRTRMFDPDGDNENVMIDLGIDFTPSDHTWVGAKLGIFALSSGTGNDSKGYADFKSFVVEEII